MGRVQIVNAGLSPKLWLYAARHFCFMENIRVGHRNSAWNNRHKRGHWDGHRIPFGALFFYIPYSTVAEDQPVYEVQGQLLRQWYLVFHPKSWPVTGSTARDLDMLAGAREVCRVFFRVGVRPCLSVNRYAVLGWSSMGCLHVRPSVRGDPWRPRCGLPRPHCR